MNKGLEALKQYRNQQTGVNVYADELLDTIEKELKQAEENEEMLNVFKNALIIERKPINNIHAFKKNREGFISSLASEIIEIKQNELDIKLRSNLREWVLKNAFPKELKTLEIIKKYPKNRNSLANFRYMVDYWEKNNIEVTKEFLETYDFPFEIEEYNLLKEILC